MDTQAQDKPLAGSLVVSLEQAVAAPVCTARLANAGARVIKIERPEGDFARGYDEYVKGEATYFVWANHGKESVCLDLRDDADRAVFEGLLERADVFVQNLSVGAIDRLGYGWEALNARFPRLIVCGISGYGEDNAYASMRAYDMLIQAESGLSSISGRGRIGVSIADIVTGINAYGAILEALIRRERTGEGERLGASLFSSMADLMAVPLLQTRYAGEAPAYMGMRHPSIVPYGAFPTADGTEVVISIQNEREWERLCRDVLGRPDLFEEPAFASIARRTAERERVEAAVAEATAALSEAALIERLDRARIAYGKLNEPADVLDHPALRQAHVALAGGADAEIPAPPVQARWYGDHLGRCPSLGENTEAIRREFGHE
ncbi:CaiB/BaiF CoA transferase family protein [Arhodomonas aquaeolei]|uniref:CaiB/BaiF CoA transferase family protein n=1 Tax=Arhodomonas aquaeolei TaxID=2369 RepID=UPI0003708F92|nr:CaiB/BaiF CoA-transferase family protein [Arhodomonas aquaeolei]